MSDTSNEPEPPYHLFLAPDEVPVADSALRLMISDEAHEPNIRELAREVIAETQGEPGELGTVTVTLTPQQMKITYSALRLLLNDTQRGQAQERVLVRAILDKLPDEHTMRAIVVE